MAHTLKSLFAKHPDNAPAIGAPGREWMTYGELKSLSQDVRKILRSAGIGATERVAIVLPNGPEMAAAFVTVAQSATTAPLNPAYKKKNSPFILKISRPEPSSLKQAIRDRRALPRSALI